MQDIDATLKWIFRRFRHRDGQYMRISQNFSVFVSDPHTNTWMPDKHKTQYVAQLMYGPSHKVLLEKKYPADDAMDDVKADILNNVYDYVFTNMLRYTGAVTLLRTIMPEKAGDAADGAQKGTSE